MHLPFSLKNCDCWQYSLESASEQLESQSPHFPSMTVPVESTSVAHQALLLVVWSLVQEAYVLPLNLKGKMQSLLSTPFLVRTSVKQPIDKELKL